MFSKLVVPLCFAAVAVEAQLRQFPVPSRLVYGPTVPIAKAAQELALGYAASMPNGIVTSAPTSYGSRVSKLSRHSAPNPTHGAYPASLAVSRAASPILSVPRYSAAPVYRPAYAAPIAAAPLVAAPAFAPKVAPQYYAAAVPEQVYAPQSYSFGYQSVDEHGNRQSRQEQGDANNFKKGSYSFTDVYGISRRVDYVADHGGFRATINTNEPGTAPSAPAAALYTGPVVHRKA
ncbi:cuticle protein 8 [Galendromus occidentalis]|uniref:Cuticle protein 8 n=1 Tax=Galendromus occidentalis TaxID=34638 RepID=A0AAJ6QTR3_9ACAR|nr:cuticle protein 8 [Galendromus occidentalis]